MQERPVLAPAEVNRDLLRFVLQTPSWFWPAAGGLALLVGMGVVSTGLLLIYGLQLLGYTNVQYWTVLITSFVFWVGISHAGVMISAILRLTQAEWRRPVTRCAEVLTVFALMTASLFPILHTGRMWRTVYWFFPYDFSRDIWPAVRSALIWDPSAIITYLTATILFVYVDLIPDLAVARDRTAGWRRMLYGALALGFRGSARQWRIQTTAGLLLSALILPVFVSVHSIVGWDFAVAIVPGWHTTVLAPYFVIGAVHSGVAGVVLAMVVLRRLLRLEAYITPRHLDTVGRLQIAVALAYLFFVLVDFYFGLYAREPVEVALWELRLFTPPTNVLFYLQVLTAFVIPFPFLLFRRFRRSGGVMLVLALLINLGMWLERYILITTPLSLKHPWVFTWIEVYEPRPIEYVLVVATLALVALGFLLFAKVFPIVPLWDVKEGQVLGQEVRVGKARVPAAIHE